MPLHIFEPRYRELIGESLEQDIPFGVIFADEDGLRPIGTLATVTEVTERFDDGRLNILVEGGERFRLVELTEGRAFVTGRTEAVEDQHDPADSADIERALALFARLAELTSADVQPPAPETPSLSFAIAGRFDFSPELKQELLAESSERIRLARLCGLLANRRGDGGAADRDCRERADERQGHPARLTGRGSRRADPPGYDGLMVVTTPGTLDVVAVRADFAFLDELVGGRPLAYLDSASSTQKPRQVLDRMRVFYEHEYANVHRGVYRLAERATEGYEAARRTVAAFVNAPSEREVIFTRSTTEALNLVAYAWGLQNLGPGDTVVVTELEHHANFVPWQFIASRTGAAFRHIPIDDAGELRLEALDDLARESSIKVVATGLVSNSLGTINPVTQLAAWAHEQGAIMVVDAAQAAPHRPIDVQALGCDFLALSSHKLCGPTGVGALWGRRELLEEMAPFNLGGEMIRSVGLDRTTFNELPYKFEAGTPAIAEAVGFGAAIDYISELGLPAIEKHEHDLTAYAMGRLGELPWVRLFGPPVERRAGIVSFEVEGIHPHDVAQILDWEGIAVRAGHHCTQPLMARLGVAATTRASFYVYTIPDDVDRLVEGLHKVKKNLG